MHPMSQHLQTIQTLPQKPNSLLRIRMQLRPHHKNQRNTKTKHNLPTQTDPNTNPNTAKHNTTKNTLI